MSPGNVRRVFAKELRETLRDRRTLLVMLVVPVFLYPALLVIVEQLAIFGQRQLEEAPVSVHAQGASDDVLRLLRSDSAMAVSTVDTIVAESVASGAVDLALDFDLPTTAAGGTQRVRVVFDPSRDRSARARGLARNRLDEWGDTLLARRLAERGLPASFAEPVVVADTSVATAERLGGYALGRFLPMLLILMTLLGAFYPAIDMSAGEKERGTLEPLLTTPVPAGDIVAGKFLTVTLIALSAATLNLLSMLLTFQFAAFQLASAAEIQFSLPPSTILMVLLFLVPLAVLFAAIFLGVALRAQSFKEAQNSLTPVQLASMIPMMLPLIPGIPLSYAAAIVPIGGVALLFRELMGGDPALGPSLLALGATVVYAGLALRFAAASFGREEVLFGTGAASATPISPRARLAAWRTTGRRVPLPVESLLFIAGIALLYFYGGVTLQVGYGERGLLLSQVALLAVPTVLLVWAGPYSAREALAARRPTPRALASALLVIVGGIPVGWLLAWVQGLVLEVPVEFLQALEELMRVETSRELLWMLLLVAITPAICEELVFRGFLLQGLLSRMTPLRAIALSAAIFGAFHLSTATVVRFLPSAWLGVLLAIVVWRTGSLFTGMLMHFVNNGLIVLLVAFPEAASKVIDPELGPRWYLVVTGSLFLAVGLKLLPSRPPPDWPPEEHGRVAEFGSGQDDAGER
jgi:sodium transport system permease protein